MKKPHLEAAYDLKTPEDNRILYAQWAETYDATFADAHCYASPTAIAEGHHRQGGNGLTLDVGAGTGLVGVALKSIGFEHVDGTDISPEMLKVAAQKGIYRTLFEGDLTKRLDVADETYDGVVSAGTFTHGHVGPAALAELLRITKPGGLITVSVNAEHFAAHGFQSELDGFGNRIENLTCGSFRLYQEGAKGPHANDLGLMVQFHKT